MSTGFRSTDFETSLMQMPPALQIDSSIYFAVTDVDPLVGGRPIVATDTRKQLAFERVDRDHYPGRDIRATSLPR